MIDVKSNAEKLCAVSKDLADKYLELVDNHKIEVQTLKLEIKHLHDKIRGLTK